MKYPLRSSRLRIFVSSLLLLSLCPLASLYAAELPRRAWFGAGFQPIDDSTRAAISDSVGARLVNLPEDGPAKAAGLEMGDIVLRIGGTPIHTGPQVSLLVKSEHRPGETVNVELWRDGKRMTKDVALIEWPREASDEFDVIYEAFEMDGALRRMIITKPNREGTFPTVFMFGGLGCYSLDGGPAALQPYVEILNDLTRAGFVTVRIEKTGMGDSQGKPCAEQDFDYEVQGLVTGMKYAVTLPYVDRDNLIIFGHSMGGFTGPVAAREFPVKGIVAMATSAIGWFEYMLTNQRRQLVLEGLPYDSVEKAQSEAEKAFHMHYVELKPLDEILAEHPDYINYLQAPAHYTFMQDVANLNIADVWKHVDANVLFIYGSSDFITARDEHLYGVELVNSFHPGHAEYAEIDDLDHYFTRMPDQKASFANVIGGMPNKQMNRDCIPVIVNWCKKIVGKGT